MELQNSIIKLESGCEYTIAQLCCGENKIVIPDLQRDYCWGDNAWNKDADTTSEIVSQFIEQLWQLYELNGDQPFTLGMIYGYEHPRYHLNLCDGQQRFTTLYLLLGMMNRRSNNRFQKYLISDYELTQDDKEPYLQYAIRETSLYFLSDLVVRFFLNDHVALTEIKKQPWYFSEYDSDATVTSILCALGIIDKFLADKGPDVVKAFGEYVVGEIKFLYYDMGSRLHGEETFVVINTTGEPLSASENIKPLLLGYIENDETRRTYSHQWEEREEWFWKNRNKKREDTADAAYLNFFEWFFGIVLKQKQYHKEDINPKKIFWENREEYGRPEYLDAIHSYFLALKSLVEIGRNDADIRQVLQSIYDKRDISLEWFRLQSRDIVLPLICYLRKFGHTPMFGKFVRRIRKNWFDKKRENCERHNSFLDWRYLVALIESCKTEDDVFTFDTNGLNKIHDVPLPQWYDENTRFVEQIEQELGSDYLRQWESHEGYKDLMGDFTVIRKAVGDNRQGGNIHRIFMQFMTLFDCMRDADISRNNPELSNFYRLFKVFIGCPGISGVYKTSGLTGAWFSWINRNDNSYFLYLEHPAFVELLQSNDMLAHIKAFIRKQVSKDEIFFTEANYTPTRHLKSWLLLKVLCAKDSLLSFWDGKSSGLDSSGNGIAVFNDCKRNMIDPNKRLSIANTIAGFAVKIYSYLTYAENENWNNRQCFDTLFDLPNIKAISQVEFKDIRDEKSSLNDEYIENTESELNRIFDVFMSECASMQQE